LSTLVIGRSNNSAPGLLSAESFSPLPGLKAHAYLLTRADGNVLFSKTGHTNEVDAMEASGAAYRFEHSTSRGSTVAQMEFQRFGWRMRLVRFVELSAMSPVGFHRRHPVSSGPAPTSRMRHFRAI
jgi:hypothetical protein